MTKRRAERYSYRKTKRDSGRKAIVKRKKEGNDI